MGFFHRLGDFGGDRHTLQVHESLAADTDRVPFDRDGDAVADFVLGIVGRRQLELELVSLVQDRQGDRVMKPSLGRGRELENSLRRKAMAGDDSAHLGPLASQRTGFVEQHGVDLVHQLERSTILDQDPFVGTERKRRKHGQGRRHAYAGAEIAVEHRDRPPGPMAAMPTAPTARVGITALSASRSPLCCELSLYPAVSFKIWLILADAVSLPDFSTWTKTLPATINVAANTRSPTPFSAGVDSPVSAC